MNRYVFDASALIALFEARPGAEAVRAILQKAREASVSIAMSTVTWGETCHTLWRRRGQGVADQLLGTLQQVIFLEEASLERALQAASLRARFALPYVDGFVVAIAMARKAAIVTSDKDFERVRSLVKVRFL